MTKTSVAQAIADAKELKKLAVEKARLDLAETVTPEIKAILEAALDETADKDEDDESAEEPMEETFNALMEKLKAEDPEKFEAVTTALAEKKAPESAEEKSEEGEEKSAENTDETLDIDAALAEIESSQELGENEKEGEEEPEKGEESSEEDEIDEDYISKILAEVEKGEEEEEEEAEKGEEKPAEEGEIDEAADLKGLLDKVKTFSKEELDKFIKALQSISPEQVKKDMAAGKAVGILPSNIKETEEASEEELLELKKELFEMNILSAKLLYQNKLLLSENFSDEQKARIIKAFDKAKTVGEVKVLFEALNVKTTKPTKTPIAESLGFRRIGQPLTEAQTTKKYNEKDPMVVEMQRKAGIIK